jgi:hypothetical protein
VANVATTSLGGSKATDVVPGADCHCRPSFGIRFAGWRWVGGSDQDHVIGMVVSPSRPPEAPEQDGEKCSAGKAAMSDSRTIRRVAAAAVIAALGTPAGAADLLPPSSERHLPHRPLHHLPVVPPGHLPRASTGLPSGERADSAIAGWGLSRTFMGTSVPFPTVPSGVIGGTQFDPEHQFSPTWLSGTETAR